jgi:cell division protein ZapA
VSKPTSEPVNIHVLDREYTVGCEPDERDGLKAAASCSTRRCVKYAAAIAWPRSIASRCSRQLNLAHELQQLRDDREKRDRELTRTLGELHGKLDDLLEPPAR